MINCVPQRPTPAMLMLLAIATTAPLSIAGAQVAAADAGLVAGLDSIFARYDNTASPGCAVGVQRDGRVVARREYGMADIATQRRITANSQFPVQSVNKMLYAFAVLRLAERRRLNIDDHVGRWIPTLTVLDSGVTLRRLMQHTSGRPDIGVVVQLRGESEESSHAPETLARMIAAFPRSMFEPGTREAYANDVQQLLPLVIERASGKPLAKAMQELVFDPAGMSGSTYRIHGSRRTPATVTPYRRDGDQAIATSMIRPGALVTRDDLLAWTSMWLSPPDSLSRTTEHMRTRTVLRDGNWSTYGLGLQFIEYRNAIAWYHGGDNRAEGHTIAIHWPASRTGVVVLCNDGDADVTSLGVAVSERALAGKFPDVAQSTAIARDASRFAGLYFTTDGGPSTLRFRAFGDTLRVFVVERDSRVLARLNAETFAVTGSPTRWIFRGDTLWRALGLSAQRYERVAEGAQPRDDIAGCYVNSAVGIRGVLRVGASGPELRWLPDSTWHTLQPVFDDGFTDGFAWLRLRRNAAGRITRATVATDRVWDMPLEKSARCDGR